ncbi:MAG TPA: hypothetical protein VNO21_19265 [Polyangiaceae bacterium]|nr:hypothetical protein [Polyangiaceae bacterium]
MSTLTDRFVRAYFTTQRLRHPVVHGLATLSLAGVPLAFVDYGKRPTFGDFAFLCLCLTPAFFGVVHAWLRVRATRFIHLGIIWFMAALLEAWMLFDSHPDGMITGSLFFGPAAAMFFDWGSDLRPLDAAPGAQTWGMRLEGVFRTVFLSMARTLFVVGAQLALFAVFMR